MKNKARTNNKSENCHAYILSRFKIENTPGFACKTMDTSGGHFEHTLHTTRMTFVCLTAASNITLSLFCTNMASSLKPFVVLRLGIIGSCSFLLLTCLWQGMLVSGESKAITEENSDMIFNGHWMIKL